MMAALGACSAPVTRTGTDTTAATAHTVVTASANTAALASATAPSGQTPATTAAAGDAMRVYKDPACGCCNAWVQHMRDSGFKVSTVDVPAQGRMDSIKAAHGITSNTASCHTAEVGSYVIEGHVPADLVRRLLREKPAGVVGLAVPGMVTGSPGMEGPDPQHYTVVAIMRDGSTRPYATR